MKAHRLNTNRSQSGDVETHGDTADWNEHDDAAGDVKLNTMTRRHETHEGRGRLKHSGEDTRGI